MNRIFAAIFSLMVLSTVIYAQQVADSAFNPPILKPAYPEGKGPVVMIDKAHHNFHTTEGRYYTFARLLSRDGYQILSSGCAFNIDSLRRGSILVISNALNERNVEDWSLPTPSAFTDEEITVVRNWVTEGGSLLLIADHMPFPGAAEKLAAVFGFKLNNGFAASTDTSQRGADLFKRSNGTLGDHPVTRGRDSTEWVDQIASFTGQAFQAEKAVGLMIFPENMASYMPQEAWVFNDSTPSVPIQGWFQGAVKELGKGRVAVFGEAAMFSAQLAGAERRPAGMNHPIAKQNPQFLLNVMHWLSRLL